MTIFSVEDWHYNFVMYLLIWFEFFNFVVIFCKSYGDKLNYLLSYGINLNLMNFIIIIIVSTTTGCRSWPVFVSIRPIFLAFWSTSFFQHQLRLVPFNVPRKTFQAPSSSPFELDVVPTGVCSNFWVLRRHSLNIVPKYKSWKVTGIGIVIRGQRFS